jgi:hypothetical protein
MHAGFNHFTNGKGGKCHGKCILWIIVGASAGYDLAPI